MLLENPATYIWYQESTWREPDFIQEIAQRTGCGLLLDVNNVHVASTNQRWDALAYMNDFPLGHVQQIHLAGHSRQTDEKGCRSEEHTSELQSLMRISYAVFCLKKKTIIIHI